MTMTPPLVRAETWSNSPTHQASRYDDILGVGRKLTTRCVPDGVTVLLASGIWRRARSGQRGELA